ncbi:MAG: hypothetical protein ACERJ2_09325 [Filomicrobium sp.]
MQESQHDWHRLWTLTLSLLVGISVIIAVPRSAFPSMGGIHRCASADGVYSIDLVHSEEELAEVGSTTPLRFDEISRTNIEVKKSYCESSDTAQRFEITLERYLLRVRLQGQSNQGVEINLYCEHIWDGSPAGACSQDTNRDQVVQHTVLVPQYKELIARQGRAAPKKTFWDHNGSRVYLVAKNDRREFFYHRPRKRMVKAGARPGTLLFTGKTKGNTYAGTAFIYDRRCGKFSYQVSGPVLDNSRKVKMRGKAPRVNRNCQIFGYRNNVLQFELIP